MKYEGYARKFLDGVNGTLGTSVASVCNGVLYDGAYMGDNGGTTVVAKLDGDQVTLVSTFNRRDKELWVAIEAIATERGLKVVRAK